MPLLFVSAEHKVSRGGEHALDTSEALGDERGDIAQIIAYGENEQIVRAGHEVAGLDRVEAGDAGGEAVETAIALGADLDLDHGADDVFLRALGVEHGAPAEEDLFGFEA